MAKHISIVFPGQGSQSIGMLDQFSNVDILSSGYDTDIFSFDLLDIISTDEEKLNQSQYTQPALVLSSHLYFRKLTKLLSDKFNLLAGHSLGEFSALLAAGSIELNTVLGLVYKRGLFMSEAPSGSMLAVMGLKQSVIDKICIDISNEEDVFVAPANINTPNQIVIGGDHKAIDIASIKLKEEGAKRCIKLKVSTASHCSLMNESALKFQKELDNIDIIKQFSYKDFEDKSLDDIKEADSKQIIKTFMRTPALHREIEMVLQATQHKSKIKKLNDSTANDEMFIAVNGPELGEADALLAKALDRKLAGKSGWHFSTKQTLFRTSGIVVNNILRRKSKLNIYS